MGSRPKSSPNGIRTRAATLRGWCPRPLDDGALWRRDIVADGSTRAARASRPIARAIVAATATTGTAVFDLVLDRPQRLDELGPFGGGQAGGGMVERVLPRRHGTVLDRVVQVVDALAGSCLRRPLGEVDRGAPPGDVALHEPRHRRHVRVPRPFGLVRVAVVASSPR